jgi:hypothetical protein
MYDVHGTLFVSGHLNANHGEPKVGSAPLAGILAAFDGNTVYIRYAFDNRPITRHRFLDLAIETAEGETSADISFTPEYSEVTPAYYGEYGMVGGHDLLHIFSSQGRKTHAAILISTKPIADLTEALGLYD